MHNINQIGRIQIGIIVLFVIMKKLVRPFVLDNDFPEFMDILVLSFPNLCEGIIGVQSATIVLLYLNNRSLQWKAQHIYLIATFLAGIYVITQEFKLHNIGGNNVYDPYDVLFSIIGLAIGFYIVKQLKPAIETSE